MPPQKKEELRKEFKESFDYGDDTPLDLYADYWLSQFDILLAEKIKRIEEDCTGSCSTHWKKKTDERCTMCKDAEIMNEQLNDIITILKD